MARRRLQLAEQKGIVFLSGPPKVLAKRYSCAHSFYTLLLPSQLIHDALRAVPVRVHSIRATQNRSPGSDLTFTYSVCLPLFFEDAVSACISDEFSHGERAALW